MSYGQVSEERLREIETEKEITVLNECIRDLLSIVEVTYTGDQEVIDRAKKLVEGK